MDKAEKQIRTAIDFAAPDAKAVWRQRQSVGFAFGSALAWRYAWDMTPVYRRERQQFPDQRGEVVQTPSDYWANGGDCDDDVALSVQLLGAEPVFVPPKAPKHVFAVTQTHAIDRVPGAPRWVSR